jgi:hypothetical protein
MSGGGTQFGFDFLPYADAFGADAGLMKPFSSARLLDLIAAGQFKRSGICLNDPAASRSRASA